MSEVELDEFKQGIFDHYREVGFPYYDLTLEEQINEMKKLNEYCTNNQLIDEEGIIKQSMHALGTAWTYFPHAWSIKSNEKKSPMELFNDDESFKKVIDKRLKRGTYVSDGGIRKELKSHTGAQGVSNFRPSAARAIYDRYCPDGAVVYDPCMGFGGRLLGAVSSPKVSRYIGCDPSQKTFSGLTNMGMNLVLRLRDNFNYEFHRGGAEFYEPQKEIDVAFTSPPYFNTEVYSNEPTQSCNAYPQYSKWLNDFLLPMLDNAVDSLKVGGYLIINIADVKSAPRLVEDFLDIMHVFADVKVVDHLKLSLSSINKTGHKYEPVFVFKKCL